MYENLIIDTGIGVVLYTTIFDNNNNTTIPSPKYYT